VTCTKASQLSVLIIEPRAMRSARFARSIDTTPNMTLIEAARDLTEAYNITEHEHPDLVVMAEEIAHRDNFPMYAEMLAMLEIEALVVGTEAGADWTKMAPKAIFGTRRCLRSGFPRVTEALIDESGGIGVYLSDRRQRRMADPVPRASHPRAGHTVPCPSTRAGDRELPRPGPEGWTTLVIGASTGGVEALIELLSAFPADCPPTLIVQHINGNFLPGLAQRLDRHCAAHVRPANPSDEVKPGTILMAPGNAEHLVITAQGHRCRLTAGEPVSGHRPSVDALFHSAVPLKDGAVGVLLTGMGRDGADGLCAMREAGAATFAQDQASCAVYGMPRAAMELGAVGQQLPISRLAPAVLKAAARTTERMRHA
jgi:two-component system chemotaxis response regulator CheB